MSRIKAKNILSSAEVERILTRATAEMEKNLKCNSSYSDLFEDFFKNDACSSESYQQQQQQDDAIFIDLLGISEDKSIQNQYLALQSDDQAANNFYLPQQSQEQQVQFQQPFFYQYPLPTMIPTAPLSASVAKPGFVRNRARKNMRQKSVVNAVKASHSLSSVANGNVIINGNTFAQNFQQQAPQLQTQMHHMQSAQIPYYQAAAQIQSYKEVIPQQQQHQPVLLAAKSPAPQMTFIKSSHPTSPSMARNPNSNSSDYVKMRLQQKIRSRMVSKGQIPPNPTDEELRMCGIQVPLSPLSNKPQQQMVTISQLPTPKQSPQQIPRAFNNNAAAFIAAPSIIPNQQGQVPSQDDYMKYVDMAGFSQKDPLAMDLQLNNFKQQQLLLQQQASADLYPPQQPQQLQQSQSQEMLPTNGTVNYDQFFSDFILY